MEVNMENSQLCSETQLHLFILEISSSAQNQSSSLQGQFECATWGYTFLHLNSRFEISNSTELSI